MFSVETAPIDQVGNFFVSTRLQVAQRKIFQLPFDLPYSKPIGQRSVNIQSFTRNTAPSLLIEEPEGTHVVQAVCELDQYDAHIFGHRQQQFAHAFRVMWFRCMPAGRRLAHLADEDDVRVLAQEGLQRGARDGKWQIARILIRHSEQ